VGKPVGAAVMTEPTFVLVTGAGATPFLWNPVVCELVLRGHRALPVQLPGHGFDTVFPSGTLRSQNFDDFATAASPIADVHLSDYVEHTLRIVEQVAERGPVVLVGHSLGGSTVTKVANAIPDALHRIVYLAAYCCVSAPTVLSYAPADPPSDSPLSRARQHVSVGEPSQTGAARTNPYSGDPHVLAIQHQLLAAELEPAKLPAVLAYATQPDEPVDALVADAQVTPATWGHVRKTYIRTSNDEVIPTAVQDRMIDEGNALTPHNPFAVQTVAGSHFVPITRAAQIAEILSAECTMDASRQPRQR
jgi:pimeloyl-ACP methyl ester carboxylesterase